MQHQTSAQQHGSGTKESVRNIQAGKGGLTVMVLMQQESGAAHTAGCAVPANE